MKSQDEGPKSSDGGTPTPSETQGVPIKKKKGERYRVWKSPDEDKGNSSEVHGNLLLYKEMGERKEGRKSTDEEPRVSFGVYDTILERCGRKDGTRYENRPEAERESLQIKLNNPKEK